MVHDKTIIDGHRHGCIVLCCLPGPRWVLCGDADWCAVCALQYPILDSNVANDPRRVVRNNQQGSAVAKLSEYAWRVVFLRF